MGIEDILANAQQLEGKEIVADGWFIATHQNHYLSAAAPIGDAIEAFPRIRLVHPDLFDRLLRGIYAYAGSPMYYNDLATVIGTLVIDSEPMLINLKRITVYRETGNESMQF